MLQDKKIAIIDEGKMGGVIVKGIVSLKLASPGWVIVADKVFMCKQNPKKFSVLG